MIGSGSLNSGFPNFSRILYSPFGFYDRQLLQLGV